MGIGIGVDILTVYSLHDFVKRVERLREYSRSRPAIGISTISKPLRCTSSLAAAILDLLQPLTSDNIDSGHDTFYELSDCESILWNFDIVWKPRYYTSQPSKSS